MEDDETETQHAVKFKSIRNHQLAGFESRLPALFLGCMGAEYHYTTSTPRPSEGSSGGEG